MKVCCENCKKPLYEFNWLTINGVVIGDISTYFVPETEIINYKTNSDRSEHAYCKSCADKLKIKDPWGITPKGVSMKAVNPCGSLEERESPTHFSFKKKESIKNMSKEIVDGSWYELESADDRFYKRATDVVQCLKAKIDDLEMEIKRLRFENEELKKIVNK